MMIGGVMHLTCKPEELPSLLDELNADYAGYRVSSCYLGDDHKLHLVVVK